MINDYPTIIYADFGKESKIMLDKEQVINALYDFVDEYGSPFATTCPEEMSIIEDALDMYYEKQKVNNKSERG